MKNISFFPFVGLVYNRYGKASDTKDAVIEVRIYYMKKAKWISTGIRVFPKEWRNGRIVGRGDAMQLNRQLDKIIADVRQVVYEMYEEGQIELDAIPSRLLAKRKPALMLLDFCRRRAEIRKHGITKDSQERYDRFLKFLEDYDSIRTFYDLNEAKVMALDKFLIDKKMKAKSRWNNYHRFLNSFILDAQKEGLIQKNPYDSVKIDHGDDSDGIDKCLEPEELEKIRTAEIPEERLCRVRDLFLFHCYFPQSYKDLQAFRPEDMTEIDGKKVYMKKRGKTGVDYTVPLLPPALAILEKYNGKLPVLSNQKYNKYLKEVATAAGLNKPLTTHWARHTGGTLLLNAGVPMGVVSKVLGHKSVKITERIYAKWLPKTIVTEVNKVTCKQENKEKLNSLVNQIVGFVKANALHDSLSQLEVTFFDYYEWYEAQAEKENLASLGGAPGSLQNCNVLAGQLVRAVRFGDYGIGQQQLDQLKKMLSEMINKKYKLEE